MGGCQLNDFNPSLSFIPSINLSLSLIALVSPLSLRSLGCSILNCAGLAVGHRIGITHE